MKTQFRIASIVAAIIIVSFQLSTMLAEASGDRDLIVIVKTAILFLIPLLILAMVLAGRTVLLLTAKDKTRFRAMRRRVVAIALIGVLVLVPCAVILRALAATGNFTMLFPILQTIEILGGLTNLVLLLLNLREGRALES